MSVKIVPMDDRAILKIIEVEQTLAGSSIIIAPKESVEKSTLAEVVVPNKIAYNRDGSPREPILKAGMTVRIPKGQVGTGVPEAPDGETWLAVPEDMIVYIVN